jgi:hypothetical protein
MEASMKSIIVLGALLFSTASYAYTDEQARLCTGDAFRLCGSSIPDVDQVTICMRKQKANLSAGCRSVFDQPASAGGVQPVSNTTRQN